MNDRDDDAGAAHHHPGAVGPSVSLAVRGTGLFEMGIRAGIDEAFVPGVQPSDHVRWGAVVVSQRSDDADAPVVSDVRAFLDQLVAHLRLHDQLLSLWSAPVPFPVSGGIGRPAAVRASDVLRQATGGVPTSRHGCQVSAVTEPESDYERLRRAERRWVSRARVRCATVEEEEQGALPQRLRLVAG